MIRPGNVPSVNQKIVQVNKAQGVKGMGQMQGTTRVIMDAVPLIASANTQTYNLFENCKQRAFPDTNLTENKLQVGESIAVQRFSVFILQKSSVTNQALSVVPLSYFGEFQAIYASFFSFYISQDQVIKKLPLESMYAPFNPYANFMGYYNTQPAGGALTSWTLPQDVYHMETSLIIPPQIEFMAQLQIPGIPALPAGNYTFHLAMKIEGIGSLYAPKSTY